MPATSNSSRSLPPLRAAAPISQAEQLRRRFAAIWGDMGRHWGVVPAVTATHGYVLIAGRPVSAGDVRLALGLSHAAVVQAFKQLAEWGLIAPGPEGPRRGRRGPLARTWVARGDPWTWFPRVIGERKRLEGDPVALALETLVAEGVAGDEDLVRVRGWLCEFLDFVRRFQRLVALLAGIEPYAFARTVELLSALPDETVQRLVRLICALEPREATALVAALAEVEPAQARILAAAVGKEDP